MKNLDLNKMGLHELNKLDKNNIKGGWIGIAVAVGLYLMSDFDSIKEGAQDASSCGEYDYDGCNC